MGMVKQRTSATQPRTDNGRDPHHQTARHERRRNGRAPQNQRQTTRNTQWSFPHHQTARYERRRNGRAPSKRAPNNQEHTTAVSPTTKQPGPNEDETAVSLKPSAKQPGANEGETAVPLKTSTKQSGRDDGRPCSRKNRKMVYLPPARKTIGQRAPTSLEEYC
jgi:hypothetical protein